MSRGEYRCDAELFLMRPTNGALAAAHAAAPALDLVLAPQRLPGMPGPAAAPPQPPSLAPTAAPATIVAVPSSSNDQPCRGAASPAPPPPVSVQAAFDALMAQKREDKSWGL